MGATEMNIVLIIAGIGHLICGITDCMLAYTKDGRFEFSDIKDNAKMQKTFSSMTLKQVILAIFIGVFALFMASFGYIEISGWISETSPVICRIMLIASMFFIVLISAHHVLCGAVEWFYVRQGRTEEALNAVTDFFKSTIIAAIAYVGLLVFAVALFILVVTGKTDLPRWACVFNTLPAFLILAPTKVPAKGNIANAFMFLGLAVLL
jgi:ABC-type Fe3+ transport system permease subunit